MKKAFPYIVGFLLLAVLGSVLYASVYAFIDDISLSTAIGGILALAVVGVFLTKVILRK